MNLNGVGFWDRLGQRKRDGSADDDSVKLWFLSEFGSLLLLRSTLIGYGRQNLIPILELTVDDSGWL